MTPPPAVSYRAARDEDRVVDFDAIAEELYRLQPAEFTDARTLRVKQAREAGQRDLAGRLQKLRKPTAGAWLANLLVREQPDQVTELLELGAALREAQHALVGEDLANLARQRQQLVNALSRDVRRRAARAGHRVTAAAAVELEDTLRAALAEPAAAELLRTGRLSTALHPSAGGFDPAEQAAVLAPPTGRPRVAPVGQTKQADRERAVRTGQADDAVRRAQQQEEAAKATAATAQAAVTRQQQEAETLLRRLRELEAELNRVRAEESLCRRELRRLHEYSEAAARRVDGAGRALAEALAERQRLDAP